MKLRRSIALVLCLFFVSLFKVDTFATTKLAAPTGVTVTANSDRVVSVYWKKVTGASYYYVYYSYSAHGKFYRGKKSSANGRTLYGLKMGDKCYVKVKAFKSGASSAYSKTVSITIKKCPSAPKSVKATYSKSTGKVTIKWNKVSKATGYYLYCSTNSSLGYKCICDSKDTLIMYKKTSVSLKASSYGLKEGQKYYFKVTAIKDKMESNKSSAASVQIQSDSVQCFPGLTTVPVIPGINYTSQTLSDGTTAYSYSLTDFSTDTEANYETLLTNNGWEYVTEQDGDGYKAFAYSKSGKGIIIYKTDTKFIITGYYTAN